MAGQSGATLDLAKQLLGLSDKPAPEGVLANVGAVFGLLTSFEQLLSAPFGLIPFPRFPALRILDMDVGLPHIHNHPPNVVPPAPPIPLPSTGPIIPIPILSGASRTLINGMPAARCGDIGLGIWCGGFFPLYEVFLGSATVWIEGQRAGRLLVDITKHCTFTCPRPKDPPTGPMFGTTISGSPNVLIGGIPMPSLTSMAVGAALKGVFKGIGKVFRKLTAKSFAARLLSRGVIVIDDQGSAIFRAAVIRDLEKMSESAAGRMMLKELESSIDKLNSGFAHGPHNVNIAVPGAQYAHYGDSCAALGNGALHPQVGGAGGGAGSHVEYHPNNWPNGQHPGTPSDAVLNHELNHAANNAAGQNLDQLKSGDPNFDNAWHNWEEHNVTQADNGYRAENGYPLRDDYTDLP
jgi:uncharacterized Zn-binding protein involved in type VI secretion